MIKVAHVINTLEVGGAETMLLKLLTHSDSSAFSHRVYTLMSPAGPLGLAAQALGVPVRELGMTRGLPSPALVFRLGQWLRDDPPDLVQTWLYHSDLVGALAAKVAHLPAPVVWNIRNGTLDGATSRRRTRWVVKACAALSARLPDAIICCSQAAFRIHAAQGYEAGRCQVIPNGFDLAAFKPNPGARIRLRRALGLPDDALVIGLVARFDPQKDHRTFIAAAARLHAREPGVHFVLCGRGITAANPELTQWIAKAGLGAVCHLLGPRGDIPDVTAALDIASSASAYGEAFPNVIGEAMACGVPCVVTDVGESAEIVGDTGRVVPPRSPQPLADAWLEVLRHTPEDRAAMGARARARVSRLFAIASVTRWYEDTYRRLVGRTPEGGTTPASVPGVAAPVPGVPHAGPTFRSSATPGFDRRSTP